MREEERERGKGERNRERDRGKGERVCVREALLVMMFSFQL